MTVCSCHATYAFQSESTLYSCLNVKELLAWSRREIWVVLSSSPVAVKPRSFWTKSVIEAGLSDFDRMTISVLKMLFHRLSPKVINYRNCKKIDNEKFMDSLHYYALSEEQTNFSKTPINFLKLAKMFLKNTDPEKISIFVGTINLSWLKRIQKPLRKEQVSETNS